MGQRGGNGREETIGRLPFVGVPGMSKIIAFFCQGSTAGKDCLEEIAVQGIICQSDPFGNHNFAHPRAQRLALLRISFLFRGVQTGVSGKGSQS